MIENRKTPKNAKINLDPNNTNGRPKMTKLPLKSQKNNWNLKNDQNTHVTSKITKNTLNLMKMTKIPPSETSKWPKSSKNLWNAKNTIEITRTVKIPPKSQSAIISTHHLYHLQISFSQFLRWCFLVFLL